MSWTGTTHTRGWSTRYIPLPASYQIEFNKGRDVVTSQTGLPHRLFTGTAYWHGSFTPTPVRTDAERRRIMGFLEASDRENGWFMLDVAQPRINDASANVEWRKVIPYSTTEFYFQTPNLHLGLGPGDVISFLNPAALDHPVTRTVVLEGLTGALDPGTSQLTYRYWVQIGHPLPGEMIFGSNESAGRHATGPPLYLNGTRPVIRAVFSNPVGSWTSSNGHMQLATQGWIEDVQTVILELAKQKAASAAAAGTDGAVILTGEGGADRILESGDELVGEGTP